MPLTTRSPRARTASRRAVCLLLGLATLAGCGKEPTSPLGGSHTVSGRVVRASGGSVEGAVVSLIGRPIPGRFDPMIAFSDAAGSFVFPDVPEADYRLHAKSGDTLAATRTLTVANGSPHAVALPPVTLAAAGVLTGRALQPQGTNHEGIILTAQELFSVAVTDSSGVYRLTGIPPGTWVVFAASVSPPGTALGTATLAAPGDSAVLADLVLTPITGPLRARARPGWTFGQAARPATRQARDRDR